MIYPLLKDLLALKRITNPFIKNSMMSSKNAMFGNFTSKVIGQGLNFESNREYVANDDLRHINWRLTAKNNKPFVKTYTADTDQTVQLVIDGNSYMQFGTRNTFKSVQAINYVGDSKIKELANAKNEHQVIGFFKQLCVSHSKPHDLDFATVLKGLNQQNSRGKIMYLISDFINAKSDNLYQEIKIMCQKHKVILISLYDKFDYDLPVVGNISVLSNAKKMNLVLSAENIKKYRFDWELCKGELDKLCLGLKINNYWVSTEQKWTS